MEEKFKNWMVEYENKAEGTVYSYSRAIEKISKHYSEHKGSPINIFEVSDVDTIDDLISHYNSGGKYEAFGNIGHKTNINGLKSYARFLNNAPKNVTVSSINTTKNEVRRNVQTESAGVFSHFDQTLRKEALRMSDSYKLFYGLEVSIRNLIKTTMEGRYGEGWWKWIDVRVKENVKNHLAYELDMPHTKRSQNNIDYTTFGDLRKIINSNWSVFESKFNRNLNSVNEVMINLNRLRVSIAHCTPLVEKEVKRLEIYVDDWFEILKDA